MVIVSPQTMASRGCGRSPVPVGRGVGRGRGLGRGAGRAPGDTAQSPPKSPGSVRSKSPVVGVEPTVASAGICY